MVLLKSIFILLDLINPVISTFHYGSIKILSKPKISIPLSLSTFHYGSIKIITLL